MNDGLKVSTPSDTTIVMTRWFDAPRALVFQAMTDPSKIRRWIFAPQGWEMSVCEYDARVGGRFRWAWKNEQADPAMVISGEVKEVVPNQRIVHTETMELASCGALGTLLATLDLNESRGRTHMTLTLAFDSKEARDGALQSGMEHGMEAGYQQLDQMLAGSK